MTSILDYREKLFDSFVFFFLVRTLHLNENSYSPEPNTFLKAETTLFIEKFEN